MPVPHNSVGSTLPLDLNNIIFSDDIFESDSLESTGLPLFAILCFISYMLYFL
ncbi:MAG: hypothetical protein LBT10_06485 [Methanobrevibacter sp.]|jgi:hypothetical protein|nr:hypothetical protein [Methanobrevibacter sp.]